MHSSNCLNSEAHHRKQALQITDKSNFIYFVNLRKDGIVWTNHANHNIQPKHKTVMVFLQLSNDNRLYFSHEKLIMVYFAVHPSERFADNPKGNQNILANPCISIRKPKQRWRYRLWQDLQNDLFVNIKLIR